MSTIGFGDFVPQVSLYLEINAIQLYRPAVVDDPVSNLGLNHLNDVTILKEVVQFMTEIQNFIYAIQMLQKGT